MATIIDKKTKVTDGKLNITTTMEETFTRDQIETKIIQIGRQQQILRQKSQEIVAQHNALESDKEELQKSLEQLPVTEIESI